MALNPSNAVPDQTIPGNDGFYEMILNGASQSDDDHTLQHTLGIVAAILAARTSLSVGALADILGFNVEDLRRSLNRVESLIYIPDDNFDPSIRVLHTSFGGYLLKRAPSRFRIPSVLGDDVLALGCLNLMAKQLHFNISQSQSSYEPNAYTKPNTVTLSLEYACLHWIYHLSSIPKASPIEDDINNIFCARFLFWLEVMSILGQLGRATAMLLFAAEIVQSLPLSRFFRDANSFVASSYQAIERSAPHIYLSALPFANKDSVVYQKFFPLCTGLMSVEAFGIDRHGRQHVMTLIGHEGGVNSITHAPDVRLIASASSDGSVRIWDVRTGQEMTPPLRSGDGASQSVAFSPHGTSLAVGTESGIVCIWSLGASQNGPRRSSGHSGIVLSVTFSPDGSLIASGSRDNTVRVCQSETGHEVVVLNGHSNGVNTVAFSPDGAILASGSDDGTIRLWDVATWETAGQPLQEESGMVLTISFSPDNTTLASAGFGFGSIQIWDLETRSIISRLHDSSEEIRCVQFSPDGQYLVSTSDHNNVRIWFIPKDAIENAALIDLEGHKTSVHSVSFSPNGRYFASASGDCTIRIWDTGYSRQAVQPLHAHQGNVRSAAVFPDGSLIVSGSVDRTIRVWDTRTGNARLPPLMGHTDSVHQVTVSSNRFRIASASQDGTVRLWDPVTGAAVGDPLTGHQSDVNAVAFSPDALWLASGSDDCTVRVWDAATGQLSKLGPLACAGKVYTVAFSPDGQLLAAGDGTGLIHIWHADTGLALSQPIQASSRIIHSISFSPDSSRIISGQNDARIRVWSVSTGQQLLVLEGHHGAVTSVAYSIDGLLISSGSADRAVRLWDALTGTSITTLGYHGDRVGSVAFTPDAQFVISCSSDKTIRIWNIETARALSSQRGESVVTVPSNTRLIDGWLLSEQGELLMWVPEEYRNHLQAAACTVLIGERRISVTDNSGSLHRGESWTGCWLGGSS